MRKHNFPIKDWLAEKHYRQAAWPSKMLISLISLNIILYNNWENIITNWPIDQISYRRDARWFSESESVYLK